MADAALWDELSDEVREAFGWAAAVERREVGTRSLLIGLMRVEEDGEPRQLLEAVDVAPETLFDALQAMDPVVLDPFVSRPRELKGFPTLTRNAEDALASAARLRDASRALDTRDLFGGLLTVEGSTVVRALERVLAGRIPLDVVRALQAEHRRDRSGRPFGELLAAHWGAAPAWEILSLAVRGPVTALAFAPGDGQLAVGFGGGSVRLHDASGTVVRQISHPTRVVALAFDRRQRHLAIAGEEGSVLVWRLSGLRDGPAFSASVPPRDEPSQVTALAYAPDGLLAAGCTAASVQVWDDEGRLRDELASGSGPALAVAFPRVGEVRTLDALGRVRRWPGGSTGATVEVGSLVAAAFSADGRWLARVDAGGRVHVLDLALGTRRRLAPVRDAPLRALALSYDGGLVASGDANGHVLVHDLSLLPVLEADPAPPRDDRVEWLTDAPADLDLLARRPLAGVLASRLERLSAESPRHAFLIHVDGPWGSGKSTILDFLAVQLSERWLVVRFDAWRQSRVGPPWWALLTSLRKAMRQDLGRVRRLRLRVREATRRLQRERMTVLPFTLVFAVAAVAFWATRPASGTVRDAATLLTAVVGSVALLGGLGGTLASFVLWDSARGAKRFEQWQSDPMETLAEHCGWLIGAAHKPVVFLVDELDRCHEHDVVALLEAIQTLMRDAVGSRCAPCFVVAADGRWIRCSYEQAYDGFKDAVAEPGRPLGYLFLDKLFQLTLALPAIGPEQQAAYLRRLLGRSSDEDASAPGEVATAQIAASTSQLEVLAAVQAAGPGHPEVTAAAVEKLAEPELERRTEHELQRFAALLERNPRAMKRFVNAYSMALSTLLLEERGDVELEALALWTILRLRWPGLATHLVANPGDADDLAADRALGSGAESLAPLGACADLLELLRFGEHALTGARIAALTGTTAPAYPSA